MKMDADDSWIDAEIARELAEITGDVTENAEDFTEDVDDVSTEITESDDIDHLLKSYQNRSNNVASSIKNQLEEIDSFLGQERRKNVPKTDVGEEITNAAKSRGVDVEKFQAEILLELEVEDAKDLEIAESAREDENSTDESRASEENKPRELTAEEGALVEFCETDELERKLFNQMNDWLRCQKEKENTRTVENEQNFHKIKERLTAMENHRLNLLDSMKKEEICLEELKTLRQAEIDIENQEALESFKMEEMKHQTALKDLENEHKSQSEYINELRSQAQSIENHKKHSAVTRIQSLWRGYRTRLEYGETVREWQDHGRRKREERRLREIESEIIKRETKEKKRMEEEQKEMRRLEMERLKEEEKKRADEKEVLRKIEEEKIESEKKRKRDDEREIFLEAERRRMIEEEKKAKEQLRLDEERKLREEKKREEEAAKRRSEDLQRVEDEKKKMEEQERIANDEQARKESERVKELEEKLRKDEDERKRKDEDKRRNEAERKAAMERQKQIEEEKRIKEEMRVAELRKEEELKKAEAQKKRLAEEKKRLAESLDLENLAKEKFNEKFGKSEVEPIYKDSPNSSPIKKRSETPEPTHDELVQKGRLAWMQSCIPLSKLLMEAKSRKTLPSTIPKRRPSSSKKLNPIPDDQIFTDGISDSYDEVFTLKLSKLPAYNIQNLTQCTNLTMVEIEGCHIVILDAFEKCQKLRSLVCRNSKVEVVNLRNLKELVYLDLSGNQLTSIHGLDGCCSLCYLDFQKNRITRIENLSHLMNLHTLDLSQNSISRTTNISEAPKIQKLNLSKNNIRKVTEFEKLSLLSHLDLSYNSLDAIPVLTNHVLIENLNFRNNGLTDVDALGVFWLPLLKELNLANNSISKIPKMESTISLKTLNLADNSFSEIGDFLPSLTNCELLENLNVNGNPVSELTPNLRDLVKTAIPWLKTIDGFKIESKVCHRSVSEFFQLCASQLKTRNELQNSYQQKLAEISEEVELVSQIHRQFFEKSHKMAADFRYAHEYGDLKMDLPESDFLKFEVESLSLRSEAPAPARKDSKNALSDISKTNIVDARSKFEMALGTKPKTGNSQSDDAKSAFDNALKSSSSTQVASLSKKSNVRLSKRDQAAVRIQSYFRGYICRKRISMACDFAKDMDMEDLDSFDEIDLDAWDLDANALDQEWIPSSTPNLVSNAPVLGPIQPGPPKEAWQNLSLKPPRSPALSSELDTTRTKGSKSDQLTEEWGFKDSKTAEMMMKRAKKLKYDALKKKRLAQLDPKQRLIMMRRLEEANHLPAVQAQRRPQANRKDYFRAKEEEAQRERTEKVAESQNKMHRMYEWLHTAADVEGLQETHRTTATTVSHKPPIGLLKRSDWAGSEGSLPKLDEARTHRSRGSDLSIHSVESDRSGPRRYSYDGTGIRNVPFPPLKNNSAPSDKRTVSPQMGWGGGKKRNTKRLS